MLMTCPTRGELGHDTRCRSLTDHHHLSDQPTNNTSNTITTTSTTNTRRSSTDHEQLAPHEQHDHADHQPDGQLPDSPHPLATTPTPRVLSTGRG